LHDSVGQYLAYAKMSLEILRTPPNASDQTMRTLSQMADNLDKCLMETRTISHLPTSS
jgi:signal transduction histidine kinase